MTKAYSLAGWLAAMLICGLTFGCQIQPVAVDPAAYGFDEPTAPTQLPEPQALYPLEVGDAKFIATEGKQAGEVVAIETTRAKGDEDFPFRRRLPRQRIEHVGVAADGSIIVGAVEDLSHHVITHFNPPMPLVPTGLKPDEPQTFESEMKIVSRDNPDRVTDTGTAKKTITYDADQRINRPEGDLQAHRIRSTYTATLKTAHVQMTTDSWYTPRAGLVAERESETVKALILQWTNKHTMIRHTP